MLATFQRLMQNCMGELNFIYCLIYLDDLIVFSRTAEEHLHRLCVVFARLREYNLKLNPQSVTYLGRKSTTWLTGCLKQAFDPATLT